MHVVRKVKGQGEGMGFIVVVRLFVCWPWCFYGRAAFMNEWRILWFC